MSILSGNKVVVNMRVTGSNKHSLTKPNSPLWLTRFPHLKKEIEFIKFLSYLERYWRVHSELELEIVPHDVSYQVVRQSQHFNDEAHASHRDH